MRPSQRLADGPLMSLTFNESEGSFTRCVVACRSKAGCFSVNVHVDRLTSLVTCELLGVYLHGAVNRLTSAADWTFIQEGKYVSHCVDLREKIFSNNLLVLLTQHDGFETLLTLKQIFP